MIVRPEPIDEEVFFDGRGLISETDVNGVITYVNRKFVEMSGYPKEEAVGSPHNILRHPDMGKDGRFYWAIVHIVPKKDEQGNITGYIASRKVPDRDQLKIVESQYKEMLEAKE